MEDKCVFCKHCNIWGGCMERECLREQDPFDDYFKMVD